MSDNEKQLELLKEEADVSKINIKVGDLLVYSASQLGDGRMEVRFSFLDSEDTHDVDDDMQFLARSVDLQQNRTLFEARMNNDPVHYIFDDNGSWGGIRCPRTVWAAYMRCKGLSEEVIDSFFTEWIKTPIKTLVDKQLVEQALKDRPWERK